MSLLGILHSVNRVALKSVLGTKNSPPPTTKCGESFQNSDVINQEVINNVGKYLTAKNNKGSTH
jgi:hypothetical protein